ncbi:MAG: hypothetical protein PHW60_02585 [Kiritimatiellae bacterium]|nr:hypothetical protein [Kiritimatiellia bacterium]
MKKHHCMSIGLSLLLLGLCSCVQYPMGVTRQQWQALTPAQQADYQAKQYAIDAEKAKQAEAERIEAERAKAQQAQAEQDRLNIIRANAQYRDIVKVNVEGGTMEFAGKHYPYEPLTFEIIKGETKEVPFFGRGAQTLNTRYKVHLSDDGNTLTFDDSYRQRIVLTNRDWEHGQAYTANPATRNNNGVALSGMTFFVKFKELPGAPQRVIIERR